jgi:hypothetical protein
MNKFNLFKKSKSTAKSSTLRVNAAEKATSLNGSNFRENRGANEAEILELSNIDNDENESDESEHILANNSSRKFIDEENISCINDLSSIESLFDSLPFDDNNNAKVSDSFFMKYVREAQFYFKIIRAIILNDNLQVILDEDCRNAKFIYFSNFLVGLGIITVST